MDPGMLAILFAFRQGNIGCLFYKSESVVWMCFRNPGHMVKLSSKLKDTHLKNVNVSWILLYLGQTSTLLETCKTWWMS